MTLILRVSSSLIVLLYPFLIYFGLRDFQPRALSCLLLVLVVLRFVNWKVSKIEDYQKTINLYWIAAALIAILLTIATGSKIGLYLYPLLVNLAFFIFFYISIYLSEEWWLLYNGFISYILIACMFGVEYLFRIKFMEQRNG